jgi:predicted membrane protein
MMDAEKLFLNVLVILLASLYWFTTGHLTPAILGYIIIILYFFDETFSFITLILGVIALLIIIYFFVIDYMDYDEKYNFAKFGFSMMYMIVIYLKSKSIFNAT